MMIKRLVVTMLLSGSLLSSCKFFQKEAEGTIIARVNDEYLLEQDVEGIAGEGLSSEDSLNIVTNYINNWATTKLLLQKARINLSEEKTLAFEELVNQYRADLYINAYKEALVTKSLDTSITKEELEQYYEQNKDNFKLNEELVQLRYISVTKDYNELEALKEQFDRFDAQDQELLHDQSLQFKSYSLNDSAWVKVSDVVQKIPILNTENKDDYLKASNKFEVTDSLGVYMVVVKDILKRNEISPLSYIQPTLKQIILNKRKLEFIRKLEKDLINEAYQKKQFKIYE
ncbi:peptidyl-prolyl cis-trans isomerase [Zhouia amylolytica]|nr:peptidyl-prolyl cis-trans isomerase [Zhouia amylolytica]